MDEALKALAHAAEQDETYSLSLLTNDGSLFEGSTRPAAFFLEESKESLVQAVAHNRAGGRRRQVDRHIDAAREFVDEHIGPMHAHVTDVANALTLAPAQWTPQHGQYSVQLPIARVAIGNVVAWWLIGGEVTDQVKQGSSWFLGGAVSG